MRRLLFVATGAFFVVATLLPTQRAFVVQRRVGRRTPGDVQQTRSRSHRRWRRGSDPVSAARLPGTARYNVSAIALGSGFFISSNGYIATNAHVVSTTKEGEEKAKQALFWQMVQQIAQQLGKDPQKPAITTFIDQHSQLAEFPEIPPRNHPRRQRVPVRDQAVRRADWRERRSG